MNKFQTDFENWLYIKSYLTNQFWNNKFPPLLHVNLLFLFCRLQQVHFKAPLCKENRDEIIFLEGDFSSAAQYFMTVGVFAFLYSLLATIVYVFYQNKYLKNNRGPLVVSQFSCSSFILPSDRALFMYYIKCNSDVTNIAKRIVAVFCDSTLEPSCTSIYMKCLKWGAASRPAY